MHVITIGYTFHPKHCKNTHRQFILLNRRAHRDSGPYACPALRSMISRSGPSRRVNAFASSAATFNFGASARVTALTVAARGSRRSSDSSAATQIG